MSNHDSPTPPAPAEVCERLKKLIQWHQYRISHSGDAEFIESEQEDMATLTAALLLIEQGDKERERLDWLESTRRALFTRDSSGIVKFDAETSATDWHCVNAATFRAAIDAARAHPTPESK